MFGHSLSRYCRYWIQESFVGGPIGLRLLQQWLEEVYFDEDKKAELSLEDARKVGELVRKMLWFEPSSRETASSVLKNT